MIQSPLGATLGLALSFLLMADSTRASGQTADAAVARPRFDRLTGTGAGGE